MEVIDRKFKLLAVNPVTGKIYTEENAMVFCAKDAALPATLQAYLVECARIGANPEHLQSVGLLIERVAGYGRPGDHAMSRRGWLLICETPPRRGHPGVAAWV